MQQLTDLIQGPASDSLADQLLWIRGIRDVLAASTLELDQTLAKSFDEALFRLSEAEKLSEAEQVKAIGAVIALVESAEQQIQQVLLDKLQKLKNALVTRQAQSSIDSEDRATLDGTLAELEQLIQILVEAREDAHSVTWG